MSKSGALVISSDTGHINPGFVASLDDIKLNKFVEKSDKHPVNGSDDDESDGNRPTWANGIEFLMSCISMSVGLGNVWRFPFTAYENGGGAFLIPYIIVLIIIGRPMYFLEMILGQFTSRGSVRIWEMTPILKGIGIGQMVGTACVLTYYCSLIGLTLFYMFSSFATELPWAKCLESWGSNCVDSGNSIRLINRTLTTGRNKSVSSSELYFLREVLKEKSHIDDGIGLPDWRLTLYLLLGWFIIFLTIVKGVKSSGKVAYFLAIFPYIVMITILVRGATLDGAINGIWFFLKPQWKELLNPKVWYAAVTQCFFSLGNGMGTITMFASYNRFDHKIYRDTMIVTSLDTCTSLLAGMTIFSILGNLAYNLDIDDISDVVAGGASLAFISYPDAIAKFEFVPQLFAVLFFFMLFVLGIGSAVALCSAITTAVWDEFPTVEYWKVAAGATFSGFLMGLVYVTPGGQWILTLVDHFGGTFLIFALAIVEIMVIFWIYGLENFCDDVEFMSKKKISAYWRINWAVLTPGVMLIIFVYSMIHLENPTYSDWQFPEGYLICGYVLLGIGIVQVPLWAIIYLVRKRKLPLSEAIKTGVRPSKEWGPKSKSNRKAWMAYKTELQRTRTHVALTKPYWRNKFDILLGNN